MNVSDVRLARGGLIELSLAYEKHRRLIAVVGLSVFAAMWLSIVLRKSVHAYDAHAYWTAWRGSSLYDVPWGTPDSFVYAPVIAQLIWPLTLPPFQAFYMAWSGIEAVLLALFAGPVLAVVALGASFEPFQHELRNGQMHLVMAALIVFGFRWPGLWAGVLLTKITPGVGLLWFAVRREWRSLGIALGTTIALVAVSFAIAPGLWFDWFGLLAQSFANSGDRAAPDVIPLPLSIRLVMAAALVVWGARGNHRWTVVVAALLGMPTTSAMRFALLAGVLPLIGWGPLATLTLQRSRHHSSSARPSSLIRSP